MKKPTFLAGKSFKITHDEEVRLRELGYKNIYEAYYIQFRPVISSYVDFIVFDRDKQYTHSISTTNHAITKMFKNSKPINLSSIKNKRKVTMLKKVTNFVEGLKQPKKTYMRLGWLEVVGDEWVVTPEGKEAMSIALLVEDITVAEYAKKELVRLEKEEKKKK